MAATGLKQLDGKDFVNGSYMLKGGGPQQGMYLYSLFEDGQLVHPRRMILNQLETLIQQAERPSYRTAPLMLSAHR